MQCVILVINIEVMIELAIHEQKQNKKYLISIGIVSIEVYIKCKPKDPHQQKRGPSDWSNP